MKSLACGSHLPVLTTAAAIVALLPSLVAAKTELSGRVLTQGGSPISKANVYIYTAAPRVGTSAYCPSCYPDCGKMRASGKDGQFAVAGLSDSLIFQVLVVATGYEPTFVKKVDPRAGPFEVRLDERDPRRIEPDRAISGRVVDPDGRPVVGATLEPVGFHQGDRSSFGYYPGTDPITITDEMGSFTLMTAQSGGAWDLRIRARDLAPAVLNEAPAGGPPLTLVLQRGATVTGRVTQAGRPLPGVVISLDQVWNYSGGESFGSQQIATDENGRFTIVNVTVGQDYWLYGTLESFRPHGVASSTRVTVSERDSMVVAPTLEVFPARHIAGRVRLSDGKPLPPGTRVTVARQPLGGAAQVLVSSDGRWETGGIPNETVQLMTRVPGYHLARASRGYAGRLGCKVAVDRDLDDLDLVLEPD
jgi:uncharacterized GH25 family protein